MRRLVFVESTVEVGKGFERHVKSDQRACEKTESIEKVALGSNTLREESGLFSSTVFENLMTASLPYCYASGVRVLSFTTSGSFNYYRSFVSSQNISNHTDLSGTQGPKSGWVVSELLSESALPFPFPVYVSVA
jgi:hypothetical protein